MAEEFYVDHELIDLEKQINSFYTIDNCIDNESKVTDYIEENLIDHIRRGDIIQTIKYTERYKNDGTFIWNGYNAERLDTNIDQYGTVSKSYIVSRYSFFPEYWNDIIKDNKIFYPGEEIRSYVFEKLKFNIEGEGGFRWESNFLFGTKNYKVFVEDADHLPIESDKTGNIIFGGSLSFSSLYHAVKN